MPSTRLNQQIRQALSNLVREIVTCPEETSAVDLAYTNTSQPIIQALLDRYPSDDMAVLKRYDYAGLADRVDIEGPGVGYTQFVFRCDDPSRPLVPMNDVVLLDVDLYSLVRMWTDRRIALKDALGIKQADYFALIRHAATLEEVEEVWPEAEQVRRRVRGVPVVAGLDADVMARIAADVAARKSVETVSTPLDTP